MTKFCGPYPELVGARLWLPTQPFEFGWASPVGCNALRCTSCGEPVRSEVLADGERRRYACGCHRRDTVWSYRIGSESDDLHPAFTDWVCGGHPDFELPATLDGVELNEATDWDALVAETALRPPFDPPGVELYARWLTRLHRLLHAEQAALSRAVAGLLSAEDPLLVRAAYDFFTNERHAAGAEFLAGAVAERREWLEGTPDPRRPSSTLLSGAALLLHERLLAVDASGAPVDGPTLALTKELALAGIGPSDTPLTFRDYDPDWLWAHGGELAAANAEWVETLVYASAGAPAELRGKVLAEAAKVAPAEVRAAVEQHFEQPDRDALLSAIPPT
ncbi:hypothetical protein [Streptomyces sp. Je 1-369]|uniref:hypothetical protein n=1 Tax=Streptomyces sp. Je 1-369 TaxID=2966192 RepID=UPI002286BC91|nr:hypothetical protein [Streptomyces sp. Je 1-369]WAL95777.1 hypothetical protein NOO62_15525 [Streptomyces sp. Je 1-369]